MRSARSESSASRYRLLLEEKRHIVEQTLIRGASLKAVAEKYDVHPATLSYWKRLYQTGKMEIPKPVAAFLPVTVASTAKPATVTEFSRRIRIRIEIPSGTSFCLESEAADAANLASLLAQFLS